MGLGCGREEGQVVWPLCPGEVDTGRAQWKEGAKEVLGGPRRPKGGSHSPSSLHLCVIFGNLPSRALGELLLASQFWGLTVRP